MAGQYDLSDVDEETQYLIAAADMRGQASRCEAGFKTLAKQARTLAEGLDANEQAAVREVKGHTGDLFAEMLEEERAQKAERATLAQLQLALKAAEMIANSTPERVDKAFGVIEKAVKAAGVAA
jgi:hypothetical protein